MFHFHLRNSLRIGATKYLDLCAKIRSMVGIIMLIFRWLFCCALRGLLGNRVIVGLLKGWIVWFYFLRTVLRGLHGGLSALTAFYSNSFLISLIV